jgi:predicted dehydrogenase
MKRVVVIGCGSIGTRHLNNLLTMKDVAAAVFERKACPADATVPWFTNINDLFEWQPTHAIVCTPPAEHYTDALKVAMMGAHCLVEKPLCETLSDARDMAATFASKGLTLGVGYMLRAHLGIQRLCEMAEELCAPVEATFTCYWHRGEKTYPGDLLAESSHEFDLAMRLLGPVKSVLRCKRQQGHYAEVCLAHERGTSLVKLCDDAVLYQRGCEIAEGDLRLALRYGPGKDMDYAYLEELESFLDGMPYCTGWEGVATMKLLEQLS